MASAEKPNQSNDFAEQEDVSKKFAPSGRYDFDYRPIHGYLEVSAGRSVLTTDNVCRQVNIPPHPTVCDGVLFYLVALFPDGKRKTQQICKLTSFPKLVNVNPTILFSN